MLQLKSSHDFHRDICSLCPVGSRDITSSPTGNNFYHSADITLERFALWCWRYRHWICKQNLRNPNIDNSCNIVLRAFMHARFASWCLLSIAYVACSISYKGLVSHISWRRREASLRHFFNYPFLVKLPLLVIYWWTGLTSVLFLLLLGDNDLWKRFHCGIFLLKR